MKEPRYIVVREYSSHTARNVLWKVLSREFSNKDSAESWLDFVKSEESHKGSRRYFIMEIVEEFKHGN